ncbi:LOW QUALITY PROTEIN: N-acetyltransferase 8-like 2 [Neosynchiropus ocellatus]
MSKRFSSVMQLVIRRYQPADKDVVRSLFSVGILEHIGPCFRNAMSGPVHLTVTLSLCVSSYLLSSTLTAAVAALWVLAVYGCSREIYAGFVRLKLRTDMQDICGNYLNRPDSCFWVAEAELNGRVQILGMVAVVAKQDGKEKYGELFRMIISPQCRRTGLGLKMAQTVLDFSERQGFSKVVLETSSTQVAAIALYEKLGFELVLTHTNTDGPFWITWLSRVKIMKMEKKLEK